MTLRACTILAAVALACAMAPATASADYDSHPDLAPGQRCSGIEVDANSLTGHGPDCQPLLWDIPAATHVGEKALAGPLAGLPDYPRGIVDRPPPLYTDGTLGFEHPKLGRTALCPLPNDHSVSDPDQVPYWKPTGGTGSVIGPDGQPLVAEEFEVACTRGSRAYYGPWYLGQEPDTFDGLAYKIVVFDNAARLASEAGGDSTKLWELNVASEVYNHFGSHHGTCYVSTDPCATDPAKAASAECDTFRGIAAECPAEDASTACSAAGHGFVAFRSTTARQGRYAMEMPAGKGFAVVENPMWMCQHHLVNQEPAAYGAPHDFRRQVGGAVGEMVLQILTKPAASEGYTPVSMAFDYVASAATTLIPPHTIAPQDTLWYAPFDLAIGMLTMHSHQNMVKGTIDVLPANPPRMSSTRPSCGGWGTGAPAQHAYENSSYFEPEICEYWREEDGPLILRKGEAIHASCMINNGFTPTQGIPDDSVRAAVEQSAVGTEILYGTQRASSYRVRYGCEEVMGVPPGAPGDHAKDCPPNPDGDGAYAAPDFCPASEGYTGSCTPANVVFSNTGADSMCIPIIMYWPLERVVNADGSVNEDAMGRLQAGDVDSVGAPGRVWKSPSDGGVCNDGAGEGPAVDDPNPLVTRGQGCRAGL